MNQHISMTGMKSFVQCRKKYWLRYHQGVTIKPQYAARPMVMGKLWALWLERAYEPDLEHPSIIEAMKLHRLYLEDQAKLRALARAYKELIDIGPGDDFIACELEITHPLNGTNIKGVIDRAYTSYIVESKLSARPDFYTHLENISLQGSTYLLANPEWEAVVVEPTRLPKMETGAGKFSDEDPDEYGERVYQDIISRPSHYFLKLNRKTGTFGVKFWRSEFPLDEIRQMYQVVYRDMKRCEEEDAWYPNELSCHVPTQCEYLPIKKTGVVSEEMYDIRADSEKQG